MSNSDEKRQWLIALIDQYEGRLIRYVQKILNNLERAREVVQDVFLRLWEEDPEKIGPFARQWLFSACRNKAIDMLRKEGRMTDLDSSEPALSQELDPSE